MDYWKIGFEGFIYSAEMYVGALCFLLFLQKRKKFYLRVGISLALLLICSIATYPPFTDISNRFNWVWYNGIFVGVIVLCRFSSDINWREAILAASCGSLLEHAGSSLYILIFYKGTIPDFFSLEYWIVYLFIYLGTTLLIARNLPDQEHYHVGWGNAAVVCTTTIIIVQIMSARTKSTLISLERAGSINPETIKLFRLDQAYAFGACILVLILQLILQREISVQRKLSENQNLWDQRQMQYEMSRENIDLITRKCHDMKYQVEALLHSEKGSEKCESFVDDVQDMIEVYDKDVHTGNEALDTILLEKGLYCKMHDIDWTCVIDGKLLGFMDVVDLFTIMGNALDNAIESVEKRRKDQYKSIGIRVWKRNQFAIIQVENTFDGELELKDGLPVTSKKDKENHGIGLQSIKTIVEKYEGTINVKMQDGNFVLTILLPLM